MQSPWIKMIENGLDKLKMKFVLNIKQVLDRTTADQAKMSLFSAVKNMLNKIIC
jgi:hypothetical protein